jgi:hypothetical protein
MVSRIVFEDHILKYGVEVFFAASYHASGNNVAGPIFSVRLKNSYRDFHRGLLSRPIALSAHNIYDVWVTKSIYLIFII